MIVLRACVCVFLYVVSARRGVLHFDLVCLLGGFDGKDERDKRNRAEEEEK